MRGAMLGGGMTIAAILIHKLYGGPEPAGEWIGHWFSGTLAGWPAAVRAIAIVMIVAAAFVVTLTLHELGHVVAGLSVGFAFHGMRVGRLHVSREFRVSWSRPVSRGAAGMAIMLPVGTRRLGLRAFVMLAAGPLTNLATAAAIVALPLEKGAFAAALAFWSFFLGAINLASFRAGMFASDGRRLMTILRHPEQARRWLAILTLNAQLSEGVWPEDLPADLVAAATAFYDETFDTIVAYMLAYLMHDGHDDGEAARALETCLGLARLQPEPMRESFMATAGVFQARRRHRVDRAEAWLADMPEQTTLPGMREQVEAAILEARGDRPGARATIDRVQDMMRARPDLPGRDLSLRLLQRWRDELAS